MTEEDDTETRVTRREALKGGSAAAVAAGSFLLQQQLVQTASAQTSEPRIQLGSDYAIDDDPDGNGDFVVTHQPSGSELRYNRSRDRWESNTVNFGRLEESFNGSNYVRESITIHEDGDASTAVDFDTGTLGTVYDYYLLDFTAVNESGTGGIPLELRLNGDSSSNYIYHTLAGGTMSQTSGDDSVKIDEMGTNNASLGQLIITGDWVGDAFPRVAGNVVGNVGSGTMQDGGLNVLYGDVSRIRVFTSNEATMTAALFGIDRSDA